MESHNDRICEAEEIISELEDISCNNKETAQTLNEELSQAKNSMCELNDTINRSNTTCMGIPEGRGREAGFKDVFSETIIESFTGMEKILRNYMQSWHRNPKRVNQK